MSSDQKKDYGVEILNHQSLLLRRSGHKITLKYIDNQINASSEFCFIRVCSFWCFHQKLRFCISEVCFGASIRSCALAYFYQRFAFSVRDQKFSLSIELLILLLLSINSMSELLIER